MAATTPGMDAVDRILDLVHEIEQVIEQFRLAVEQEEVSDDDGR